MSEDFDLIRDNTAIGALSLDVLSELAFVSTYSGRDADSPAPDHHGYQRDPSERRFPSIGRYFAQGGLITPLLVSVRVPESEAESIIGDINRANVADVSDIHRQHGRTVFSVVDGQHRLGGLRWAQRENPGFNPLVPCVLMFGLTYADEARLFDTINATQRGLPKALIEVSKATITERGEETYPQVIRTMTYSLATDADSVWRDRVNMTGMRGIRGTSFEALRRGVQDAFPSEFLARIDAADFDALESLKAYWLSVSEACADAWNNAPTIDDGGDVVPVSYRLHDAVGIIALSRLARDVITTAIADAETQAEVTDAIRTLVDRLSTVDWRKTADNPLMAGRAGYSGGKAIYEALYAAVFVEPERQTRRGRRGRAA